MAQVCDDYWQGHVLPFRAKKGATEVRRMFDKMLGDTAGLAAKDISRAEAFDLIKGYAETAPVQAGTLDGKVRAVEQKTIQSTVYFHQPYSTTRPEAERARLPVSHWAPHDLRRTARTLLASMGCPDAVGESILGHMLPGVLGVYNKHAYDAERVE